MARGKKHTPEQIVSLLRQIEVAVANGKTTPVGCRDNGINEQTYYRWRKEYGGLQVGALSGTWSKSAIRSQLLRQVDDAIAQADSDPWGFGDQWSAGDTTSHGAGLSVMASEAYALTRSPRYDLYSQRW